MDVQVKWEGIDITNEVISYTRNHSVCDMTGLLNMRVKGSTVHSFSPWDTIVITENGKVKGKYFISSYEKIAPDGYFIIVAQDGSKRLQEYFIPDIYLIDYYSTAKYWIEKFLTEAGVNYNFNTASSGGILSMNMSLGGEIAYDVIITLLEYSGWFLYFDGNGTAQIGEMGVDTGNIKEVIGNNELINLHLNKNDKMLRNRAVVWGNGDPLTETYVYADISVTTPWNYSASDSRAIVLAQSGIRENAIAYSLAGKLINEFARITEEKQVQLVGGYDISIGDTVFISTSEFSGTGLVMEEGTTADKNGFITTLMLDTRCPRLFGFYQPSGWVHIGTSGGGVWRKHFGNFSWTSYGLDGTNVTDLAINNGLFAAVADGIARRRTLASTYWWNLEPASLEDLSIEDRIPGSGIYDSSQVTCIACTINRISNDITFAYNLNEEYETIAGPRSWIINYPNAGYYGNAYQVALPSGGTPSGINYDFNVHDIKTDGSVIIASLEGGGGIENVRNSIVPATRLIRNTGDFTGAFIQDNSVNSAVYITDINKTISKLWNNMDMSAVATDDTYFYMLVYQTAVGPALRVRRVEIENPSNVDTIVVANSGEWANVEYCRLNLLPNGKVIIEYTDYNIGIGDTEYIYVKEIDFDAPSVTTLFTVPKQYDEIEDWNIYSSLTSFYTLTDGEDALYTTGFMMWDSSFYPGPWSIVIGYYKYNHFTTELTYYELANWSGEEDLDIFYQGYRNIGAITNGHLISATSLGYASGDQYAWIVNLNSVGNVSSHNLSYSPDEEFWYNYQRIQFQDIAVDHEYGRVYIYGRDFEFVANQYPGVGEFFSILRIDVEDDSLYITQEEYKGDFTPNDFDPDFARGLITTRDKAYRISSDGDVYEIVSGQYVTNIPIDESGDDGYYNEQHLSNYGDDIEERVWITTEGSGGYHNFKGYSLIGEDTKIIKTSLPWSDPTDSYQSPFMLAGGKFIIRTWGATPGSGGYRYDWWAVYPMSGIQDVSLHPNAPQAFSNIARGIYIPISTSGEGSIKVAFFHQVLPTALNLKIDASIYPTVVFSQDTTPEAYVSTAGDYSTWALLSTPYVFSIGDMRAYRPTSGESFGQPMAIGAFPSGLYVPSGSMQEINMTTPIPASNWNLVSMFPKAINRLEVTNYLRYYFASALGSFYERAPHETEFSEFSDNLPSDKITVIRVDDRV